MEKVFAKAALLDGDIQVAICRRDDPDINVDRSDTPDPRPAMRKSCGVKRRVRPCPLPGRTQRYHMASLKDLDELHSAPPRELIPEKQA
jgi:hypothetical protein